MNVSHPAQSITSLPEVLPIQPGGNPALWETVYNISALVTNSGSVKGATVPQLYVTFPDSAPRGTPPKQLRGFAKNFLEPTESKAVAFELMRRDLRYWDISLQESLIPDGEFTLRVGFSSRDEREFAVINPSLT